MDFNDNSNMFKHNTIVNNFIRYEKEIFKEILMKYTKYINESNTTNNIINLNNTHNFHNDLFNEE